MHASSEPPQSEWDRLAVYWIARCRGGEPNREGLLDAWMWRAIGDVSGLQVIDLGCGEGRFCRMLAERGAARVLGVDLCRPLLEAAERACTSDRETYLHDDMQELRRVPSGAFDLAVSYLTLVDVPDLEAAVESAYRVLRAGGRFMVCNLAPMATAVNTRITEADGSRIAFRVDRYFDESTRVMTFGDHRLTNYHRSLSSYIASFLGAGFALKGLLEPFPTDADLQRYSKLANERRAPSFVIYILEKGG